MVSSPRISLQVARRSKKMVCTYICVGMMEFMTVVAVTKSMGRKRVTKSNVGKAQPSASVKLSPDDKLQLQPELLAFTASGSRDH